MFRTEAKKCIDNLLKHIQKGCLSDPDIPLYYERSNQRNDGMVNYRCVRGTNSVEGYHRHLRKLLGNFAASPQLLHSVLMEFNYRWNVNRMTSNRGLPESIGCFYHQELIERIQTLTSPFLNSPLYPSWTSISEFEDTMERFGFKRNLLNAASREVLEELYVNEAVEEEEENELNQIDGLEDILTSLTKSQRYMAFLDDVKIPCIAVSKEEEKKKFLDELPSYRHNPREGTSRSVGQSVDFDRWASDWNAYVEKIEKGIVPTAPLFRKTASHLQSHYKFLFSSSNVEETTRPFKRQLSELTSNLRETDSLHPPPLKQLKLFEVPPEPKEVEKHEGTHVSNAKSEGTGENMNNTGDKRFVTCHTCGHNKFSPFFRQYHLGRGNPCSVTDATLKKQKCVCDKNPDRKAPRGKGHFHPCDCANCL